jgi:hypothetical protein
MKGDLDRLYVERLVELVRSSSLGAAVILAHDQVYSGEGKLIEGIGSFYVPNEYVLRLARKHPEFLPAVSIHPARRDAFEELERCLTDGAVMMKCLPNCHNIDCNDRRYQKFWERMAEAGLPLLAHTGGEHTVPVVRRELSDPRTLELPLQCGVKVIAAHCGTKSGLFDPEYFGVFAEMTRRQPLWRYQCLQRSDSGPACARVPARALAGTHSSRERLSRSRSRPFRLGQRLCGLADVPSVGAASKHPGT